MKKLSFLKRGCVALALLMTFGSAITNAPANTNRRSATAETVVNRNLPAVPDKGAKPADDEFVLLYDTASDLFVGEDDFEGVELALNALAGDIELVGGKKPSVKHDASELSSMAVITGTIGKSAVIDGLISGGKIDVSAVEGKWESYILCVVEDPLPNVERALVVAGSDKRGTIYGIYKISEYIGVSPWVWWADSYPERSGKLTFKNSLNIVQGEPSVKYRGIFLNDESPGLSGWVGKNFPQALANSSATKGYNNLFYAKVFELILRLKGNYLWPAMWNNSFNTDDPLNPVTANKYGVVMGTSHQEHMTCADKEWSWSGKGKWDYHSNKENVYNFWKDGVESRKDFETVLTLGMRGQEDTSILGSDATLEDNIRLLQEVIDDQRNIVQTVYGADDAAPQVLALYKEVENYYYGSEIMSLDVPEDVTLLICDDNFGNVRALPTQEMLANRSGGFGMYYHFDYRGGPISYEWINQTPLNKVWEQMTTAYDAGVQEMWIVNVGDLKPMELPIDYFLNLAYDYEEWSPENKVDSFTRDWAAREFGEDAADAAANALNTYTKITGARKSEIVLASPSTFSLTEFDEADILLREFEKAVTLAEAAYNALPDYKKDAFFQLVLYPARASMNTYKTQIYAAWSQFYAHEDLPVANEYAELAKKAFEADAADMEYYNKTMSDGKWDAIMRQNHMGYTTWDSALTSVMPSKMPAVGSVTAPKGSVLALRLQNKSSILKSGSAQLDSFDNLSKQNRYVDILNGGALPFSYKATTDVNWLNISNDDNVVICQSRIGLAVDWTKVSADSTATLTITGAGSTLTVNITVKYFNESLTANTYVETDGYVSINPKNYTQNKSFGGGSWGVIDDYGRDGDSVKVLKNGQYYEDGGDAPYLEYSFYIQTAGTYNVNTFIAPSINAKHKSFTPVSQQLRFSTQIDSEARFTKSGLTEGFEPGEYNPETWQYGVTNNTRIVTTLNAASLNRGLHTLRIYAVDPNVVVQKIVIATSSAVQSKLSGAPPTYHFMNSYFGPSESYYKNTAAVNVPHVTLDSAIMQFGASDVTVTFTLSNGNVVGTATAYASNGSKLTAAQIAGMVAPEKLDQVFTGWELADGIYVTEDTVFALPATVVAAYGTPPPPEPPKTPEPVNEGCKSAVLSSGFNGGMGLIGFAILTLMLTGLIIRKKQQKH